MGNRQREVQLYTGDGELKYGLDPNPGVGIAVYKRVEKYSITLNRARMRGAGEKESQERRRKGT